MDKEIHISTQEFVRSLILTTIKLDKYSKILFIGDYCTGNLTELILDPKKDVKGIYASQMDSLFQGSESMVSISEFREINEKFDLVIISEVLYNENLEGQKQLFCLEVDNMLRNDGVLLSIHLDLQYDTRFPYLLLKESYHDIEDNNYRFEVYVK